MRYLVLLLCILSQQLFAQHKPNIIYIYADDLGYGELGSYGQTKIKTPNLDRMAKEGMQFTQHYTGTPVCAPARCMLLTGKHGGHSYIRGNYELGGFPDSTERGQLPLKEGIFTIADLLKQKGYATAVIGKWGLGMADTEGSPLRHGFDYFYGYLDQKQAHNYYPTHLWENNRWDTLRQPFINVHKRLNRDTVTQKDFDYFKGVDYAPEKMTEKALGFIDANKKHPFFLYLPYTIPHASLQVPDEWIQLYKGKFDEKPYYGEKGYAASKYPLSAYAAMITYLDAQVGIIMQKIKDMGLDKKTIIMFSSDNGATFNGGVDARFFNSMAGLRGFKMDLYEGGIRMPFIVRWPGKIKKGTTSNLISAQYDLLTTIADITKQKVTDTDGISFLPELLGKKRKQQKHAYLYFEYPENGGGVAIRMGNWKGVKLNMKKDKNATWEIYDLKNDPYEKNNIARQHPELVLQFNAIVKKEHRHSPIKQWEFVD
ncbi:MAG: arylsulfatase [Niabella sp.]